MNQNLSYRFPFASYPALRIVLLLISGICLASLYFSFSLPVYLGIFFGTLSLLIAIEYAPASKFFLWKSAISNVLYLLLIIAFGAALMSAENKNRQVLKMETSALELYDWEKVSVTGKIYSRGRSTSGRNIYEIRVTKTTFPENIVWHKNYKIRLYADQGAYQVPTNHQYIEAEVELYEFPEKRNPHEFDYGAWLLSKSIVAHGELVKVRNSYQGSGSSWSIIRQNILYNVDQMFEHEEASLAKALFIGYKKELTEDTRQAFSRAGLSHIMAVSGMHVGFIVAPFWLLIPWLWRWTWGKYVGLVLLTLLLFSYAGITGFSASVSRASIMAWLLTYGKLFQKIRHSVNLLAAAAIILLIIQPSDLFDVGFQLSFSAVMIILLVMPEAQRLIPIRYRYNRVGGLMTIILISVIVQLGLFPILSAYFGEFSLMGPIANALVVPLLGVVVPAGLLISISGNWFGYISGLISVPISWSLNWIGEVAMYAGGTSWSYLTVTGINGWLFPVWLLIVLITASIRIPTIRWKLLILFVVAANIMLVDILIEKSGDNRLIVTVLDVGQGDAIHIKTPLGKHIMVDAGRWSPGSNSGERTIIPYLKHQKIKTLDGVILSHPHADHIGGMPDLITEIPIKKIYQSSYPYDSRLYERYMSYADSLDIVIQTVASGDIINIDPSIRLFILGPEHGPAVSSNINNASVSFRLDYEDTSFLFTGDAEAGQERHLLNQYGNFLDTDALKTGHHGSKTSSTQLFIDQVSPEITFTSVAYRNRFGHPNQVSISILSESGAKNYFTSLSGALIFTSDGKNIGREK